MCWNDLGGPGRVITIKIGYSKTICRGHKQSDLSTVKNILQLGITQFKNSWTQMEKNDYVN